MEMDHVNDIDNKKILKEQEIQEELRKNITQYRDVVNFMGSNIPTEAMCLPMKIEEVLIGEGFIRIYDFIAFLRAGHDLTEIKGIGKARARILESRLDEFFSVTI